MCDHSYIAKCPVGAICHFLCQRVTLSNMSQLFLYKAFCTNVRNIKFIRQMQCIIFYAVRLHCHFLCKCNHIPIKFCNKKFYIKQFSNHPLKYNSLLIISKKL